MEMLHNVLTSTPSHRQFIYLISWKTLDGFKKDETVFDIQSPATIAHYGQIEDTG